MQNQWIVPRNAVQLNMKSVMEGGPRYYVVRGTFQRKEVAVKCIFNVKCKENLEERVRHEIYTMGMVRHPNLVFFIAAVLDNPEGPLIVTELLDRSMLCL